MSNESKSENESGSEDAGKVSDSDKLNALLAKWDDDGKTEKSEKKEVDVAQEIGALRYEIDIPKVVKQVKGDLEVSDDFVEAYVNGVASKDQRLLKLWDGRKSDPGAFDEAMAELNKKLSKELKVKSDDKEKDDDKGLAAAARMARDSKTPDNSLDDVNFGQLSDSEFALKKQEVFRLAKAGKLKTA